jgi:hypothetical protein
VLLQASRWVTTVITVVVLCWVCGAEHRGRLTSPRRRSRLCFEACRWPTTTPYGRQAS